MMARLGSEVTILQRSNRILPMEAPDLTDQLTTFLKEEGIRIVTGVDLRHIERAANHVRVVAEVGGRSCTFEAEQILAATGRRGNTDGIGLENVGLIPESVGTIYVTETLSTKVGGIYAAGDVIGEPQFVYTAAYEGALAAENALTGTNRPRDYTGLPWVIFTDPHASTLRLRLSHSPMFRGRSSGGIPAASSAWCANAKPTG